MSESPTPQRHQAAIADFTEDGDFHVKTIRGEHLIITLGAAQIISLKRGADRYVAMYEVAQNAKPEDESFGVRR